MDERIIKMKELMQDEAFVKELCAKANAEELRTCFGEHGIEMSPEEINQIIECAGKVRSGGIDPEAFRDADPEKMSLDDLDQVAGGVVPFIVVGVIAVVGVGAVGYLAATTPSDEDYRKKKMNEKVNKLNQGNN